MFSRLSLFFKILFVCLVSALIVIPSSASDPVYTYSGGYYWSGGIAYTRQKVWDWNTYWDGCQYQGYWTYHYQYDPANIQVTPTSPDWRIKLLEIAAARDGAENKLRVAAQEQDLFNETVAALGLTGNFRIQDYGRTSVRFSNQTYQLNSAGVSGNTIYGYSTATLKDVWGDGSPAANYQQAALLAKNSQDWAGDAYKAFTNLVGLDAVGRARAAEILVRGIAAAQALEAAKGPTQTHIEQTSTGTVTTPTQVPIQTPTQGGSSQQPVGNQGGSKIPFSSTKGGSRCAACHIGANPEGAFLIDSYPSLSSKERGKVLGRVLIKDLTNKSIMPPVKDKMGNPIPRLTQEELADFLK